MLLVDTSIWIEFFRDRHRVELESIAVDREILTCLPVVQEVLQGFRDEAGFRTARAAMLALPILESPLSSDVFLTGVDLYRRASRAGLTVRSSVDCLIAACALRHDVEVFHLDRDFDALARISPLRVRTLPR